MLKKVKIAPSIIAVNYKDEKVLNEALLSLSIAKVSLLHLDVMDGKFVSNKTFNHTFVEKMKNKTDFVLDVHLMVDNPEDVIHNYITAGADILTIHHESTIKAEKLLNIIRDNGLLAGISINPETKVEEIKPYLDKGVVDIVLLMSVDPGACGQKFNPIVFDKIEWLKNNYPKVDIEVDGGINLDNAPHLVNMGVDVLVSGSTIFNSSDIAKTIKELKKNK